MCVDDFALAHVRVVVPLFGCRGVIVVVVGGGGGGDGVAIIIICACATTRRWVGMSSTELLLVLGREDEGVQCHDARCKEGKLTHPLCNER
jgi:hypothetical protein